MYETVPPHPPYAQMLNKAQEKFSSFVIDGAV
jgi:hypothetical protein